MNKIEVGNFVLAKGDHFMQETGNKFLSDGKIYCIIHVCDDLDFFSIIDDEGDEHEFEYSLRDMFFEKRIFN